MLSDLITKKTSTNTSSKKPQFYNAEKKLFIDQIVNHAIVEVRLAACSNTHVPAQMLSNRLDVESDDSVIKAILMNPNLSKKKLVQFALHDHRATRFDDDEELTAYMESLDLEV